MESIAFSSVHFWCIEYDVLSSVALDNSINYICHYIFYTLVVLTHNVQTFKILYINRHLKLRQTIIISILNFNTKS